MTKAVARRDEAAVELLRVRFPEAAPRTVKAYRGDLREYVEYCREHDLALGEVETLKAYKRHIQSSHKATTVNRKLIAVKRGLGEYVAKHYTQREAEVLRAAYRGVKQLKRNVTEKRVAPDRILRPVEVRALQAGSSVRLGLAIELLYRTGLRAAEACGIRYRDLVEKPDYFEATVTGKGEKVRTVLLPKGLVRDMRAIVGGTSYLLETSGGKPVRPEYLSHEIRKAGARVLHRRVVPHDLRHTFATDMIAKTRKVKATSEYLGHSSVATTLDLYTHEVLTAAELLGETS